MLLTTMEPNDYYIIGFTGVAGCGKTTAAQITRDLLNKIGVRTHFISFAEEVKRIAARSFGWDGKKDTKGRKLLQVIGTECGRDYNPNIWVGIVRKRIFEYMSLLTIPQVILIDDVRFNNEAKMITEKGIVMKLSGRRSGKLSPSEVQHRSEQGISDVYIVDTIDNSGNFDLLSNNLFLSLKRRGLIC